MHIRGQECALSRHGLDANRKPNFNLTRTYLIRDRSDRHQPT